MEWSESEGLKICCFDWKTPDFEEKLPFWGCFWAHLVACMSFVFDVEGAKPFVSGVLVRGARGSNFWANALKTFGLYAEFSVFEDFLLRDKTTLNSTWFGVVGVGVRRMKDGV